MFPVLLIKQVWVKLCQHFLIGVTAGQVLLSGAPKGIHLS